MLIPNILVSSESPVIQQVLYYLFTLSGVSAITLSLIMLLAFKKIKSVVIMLVTSLTLISIGTGIGMHSNNVTISDYFSMVANLLKMY